MNEIIQYIRTNWIEITGAILSIIYISYSIRQHILLWLFGLLSSCFYTLIFIEAKLYADMSLQLYYVLISIYGWIHWKYGNKANHHTELATTSMSRREIITTSIATVGIYLLYWLVLTHFTDSPIPILDSIVGALSVVGTWMLAKKQIENWLVWIAVDAFCIGLYAWKGLYPTAILFFIYTVMAVIGYRQWKVQLHKKVPL